MKTPPVAAFIADLHLRHTPPSTWRPRGELTWYEYMAQRLKELRQVTDDGAIPLFIAGDVFDRWNSPPELINFAIDQLPPNTFLIAGQHDLPEHRWEARHKSAFGSLIRSRGIDEVNRVIHLDCNFYVAPVPWGHTAPVVKREKGKRFVALLHRYMWSTGKNAYVGAPEDQNVERMTKEFSSYDYVIAGDNHTPLQMVCGRNKTYFTNCGVFLRQKRNEMKHHPRILLLQENGTIKTHKCETVQETFAVVESVKLAPTFQNFLEGCDALELMSVDFLTTLERSAKDLPKRVRAKLWELIDEVRNDPKRV